MKKRKALLINSILLTILFILWGCGNGTDTYATTPESSLTTHVVVDTSTEELLVTGCAWETTENNTTARESSFEIYFIDVGQGDAACVLCDGRAMLVDGGNKSSSSIIYSFLKSHDVNYLDYIIASHPDADHVGGLAGALNYASVGTAYCTVQEFDSEPFNDFTKYLKLQDREITVPTSGDVFYLGSAKVTIVYPQEGEIEGDNTSIALRIEYGQTSFFFAGDCESQDEAVIIQSGYSLKSNVLKVAHHGSRYSSTNEFLNAIQPDYAVISVGGDNQYGHPTNEVLSDLQDRGVTLFRTDIQGTVHCISDGRSIRFEVERNANFDTYLAAGGYQKYLREQTAIDTETAPERALPEEDNSEEIVQDVLYVVNTNTRKFHYPSCSSVSTIKDSNKWEYTGTRQELIEMGYDPCGKCHP